MIAARSEVLARPVVAVLVRRVLEIAARFIMLADAVQAGGVRRARPPRPVAGDVGRAAREAPEAVGLPDRLPDWMCRRSGWMLSFVPQAASCGEELRRLLAEPDMQALAAASPQIARLLRSACRMLAVDPGDALPKPARRAAVPRRPVERAEPEPESVAEVDGLIVTSRAVYLPDHYPPFGPPPKRRRKYGARLSRRLAEGW